MTNMLCARCIEVRYQRSKTPRVGFLQGASDAVTVRAGTALCAHHLADLLDRHARNEPMTNPFDVERRIDADRLKPIVARNALTDEPQTALLLTQQEWDDLCDMLLAFAQHVVVIAPSEDVARRRSLAERIIEANQ